MQDRCYFCAVYIWGMVGSRIGSKTCPRLSSSFGPPSTPKPTLLWSVILYGSQWQRSSPPLSFLDSPNYSKNLLFAINRSLNSSNIFLLILVQALGTIQDLSTQVTFIQYSLCHGHLGYIELIKRKPSSKIDLQLFQEDCHFPPKSCRSFLG